MVDGVELTQIMSEALGRATTPVEITFDQWVKLAHMPMNFTMNCQHIAALVEVAPLTTVAGISWRRHVWGGRNRKISRAGGTIPSTSASESIDFATEPPWDPDRRSRSRSSPAKLHPEESSGSGWRTVTR